MAARNKRMEQTGANPIKLPDGFFEEPARLMLPLSSRHSFLFSNKWVAGSTI